MSITFFIVGAVIFAVYIWFTVWIIFSQNKAQREENYPNIDVMDEDGVGNYGRIPNKKVRYVPKRSNVSGRRRLRTENQ